MPIYRKTSASPGARGGPSWEDIAAISPIAIQSGEPGFSFIATLTISGLTVPQFTANWGIVFRIVQGEKTIATHYMGTNNGPWQPSFTLVGVGDVDTSGPRSQDIHAQWMVTSGLQAIIKENAAFAIYWDGREN